MAQIEKITKIYARHLNSHAKAYGWHARINITIDARETEKSYVMTFP